MRERGVFLARLRSGQCLAVGEKGPDCDCNSRLAPLAKEARGVAGEALKEALIASHTSQSPLDPARPQHFLSCLFWAFLRCRTDSDSCKGPNRPRRSPTRPGRDHRSGDANSELRPFLQF